MTKKAPSFSIRHVFWFGWKLVILVSVALCVLALLRLQSNSELSSISLPPQGPRFYRVSVYQGNPKIAFLFSCVGVCLLIFCGGVSSRTRMRRIFRFIFIRSLDFMFYVAFLSDKGETKKHRQVAWGESSMIQAERLLFEAALEDPANQRFVLLSDSCVPLYNFSYIYNYMMASPRSYVDSFLDVKEGRYNPKMSPVIPKAKWRKGSQWISLVRSHAEVIVDDQVIFSVFKKFCKRRPPVDARKGKQNIKLQKQHNCIPDEHYVQTLLAMSELESELERRTLTYTEWNLSVTKMEREGWHPITFSYANAGPQRIKEIKDVNHVYYETEFRTEWCRANSTSVPCFLFARKFSRGAAMRLLSEGVVGSFDVTAFFDAPS
ncbi:hypothetical protein CK203_014841 [Vitis vinifera]|uniref:Glycosyltransferase BC10 n=1 Tax=Vitis vinifera TaxID=29760 RepID=A0A438JGE1_VITVI|nr:hypothetical protein CK203_014841 [Vitis vinifera]